MRKDGSLDSVDNALRLLLLLPQTGGLGVTQAAEELGVAPSTAHRLLTTLAGRGFVTQIGGDRRYVPGPSLAQLAMTGPQMVDLRSAARPHLEWLNREVGETVHLMVRVGRQVSFLSAVESTQPLRVSARVGVLLPAHLTSGGKALLAALPLNELEMIYRDEASGEGLDDESFAALKRELQSTRRRGYGLNVGETERGISAIAVPIRDLEGHPVAAVALSVPSVRFSRGRIKQLLEPLNAVAARMRPDLLQANLD